MRDGPLEKTVVTSIRKALTERGWWVMKIHGGPYQRPGIPDLLCCKNGRAVWLEVKTKTGRVSPAQEEVMREITAIGGCRCAVVRSVADAIAATDE